MNNHKLTEFSLIDQITKKINHFSSQVYKGIGDDTAIIKESGGKLLFTTDAQVEGVHFSTKYLSYYQIGKRAVAINISDVAAMGGFPKYILVSLFIQRNISSEDINQLYDGMLDECKDFGVEIIGGNISKSNQFIIDIFLTGEMNTHSPLLRSAARLGDKVLVTGTIGDSACGLKILADNKLKIPKACKDRLLNKHILPIPRVKEGIFIAKSGLATSMIDISDGLSSDLGHICEQSHKGVRIYSGNIPISKEVKLYSEISGTSYMEYALNGGEDYELCFTASERNAEKLINRLKNSTGTKATIIGEIVEEKYGRKIVDFKGKSLVLVSKGWDHLKKT
jgi:thiamine-monophosphate kinase